ncbi:MAG: ROK family protein [bacterium]
MNLLGIDIGGTKTAVCIGNEKGAIVASQRMPSTSESIESYRHDMIALCRAVIEKAGLTADQLDAIGISAPGPLDCKRGILIAPPNNPGWHKVPIVEMVRNAFKVPVFLNNDANACALAEMLFGQYKGTKNLLYLTFSTGMGGGIIANGDLIQGVTDAGGEVGHFVLDPNGPVCGCGQKGCWEAYVGGRALARLLKGKIQAGNIKTSIVDKAGGLEGIDMKAFEAAAREGDPFAVAEWDQLAERMAQGMGGLIMVLNPDVVILGTIAIHCGDFIMKPILEKIPKYTWEWPLKACTIASSSLGEKIGDLASLGVALTGVRKKAV